MIPVTERTFVDVGSFPSGVGRWGHHDLAGSMREWTADQDGTDWYKGPPGNPCDNCINEGTPNDDMIQRGGSWDWSDDYLLTARRFSNWGRVESRYSGIRCARDLQR